MKKHLIRHTVLSILIVILLIVSKGYAKIPEPGNIIYGLMPLGNTMISLQINGEVITYYSLGDIPEAGQHFVLRVPIDTMDPQEPGTARPGDVAQLFLDAETAPLDYVTVTIGERGRVHQLFLHGIDTDEDGAIDEEDNCPGISNDDQNDANNNGIGDACDEASDTDGDGYNDKLEYEYFQSGRYDLDGIAYDPLVVNAPGDEGYVAPDKTNFWLLMLPVILSSGQAPQ